MSGEAKEPMAGAPSPIELKYSFTGYHKFLDPDGYPAVAPPWGTLNAINLNTGEYAWKIPLGEYPELAAQGIKDTGTENYGGPIVTAGGLVFIGATNFDRKFRAFDKDTGKLLWETTMVNSGNATPATYRNRRQRSMWSLRRSAATEGPRLRLWQEARPHRQEEARAVADAVEGRGHALMSEPAGRQVARSSRSRSARWNGRRDGRYL